ncbi:Invasin domain protein [hydrothermal vent metagenome]|uniref:Invasin domain protein n=1 Tax=hydrothermal vent metagenome TaxID=652676 RepID=A0A3B0ZR70_9ZZZZ
MKTSIYCKNKPTSSNRTNKGIQIMLSKALQLLFLCWIGIALVSCGGSEGFTGSSTAVANTTTTTTTTSGVQIGNGVGASFSAGLLDVSVSGTLSAGGTATITATLVDGTGTPFATATNITFTSTCTSLGLSTLDSPVTTVNGVATSSYTAIGCSGADTITATATVEDTTLTASGTVTVAASAIGSIQFISATPTSIALQGTGGAGQQETAAVKFKVLNSSGGPVPTETVTFSLSTLVGGLSISPASGTTGIDGTVQTTVQAGSIATPVRVVASVTPSSGGTISTQSDQLTVTTGIPDQDSFDIVTSIFNPNAFNVSGTTATITAFSADRYNNPVPDGTTVNFHTEGGLIGSSCSTTAGTCTVTWTSSNPRPGAGGDAVGVSTILAYAIGEESFTDEDGNGRYGTSDTFTNIGEAFADYNWNQSRDNSEPYIDFDVSGTYTSAAASGNTFNGVLCEHPSECSSTANLNVFDQVRIIMSNGTNAANIALNEPSLNVQAPALLGPTSVTATITDSNGNVMPQGTTITFVAPSGASIVGTSSFTIGNVFSLSGTTHTVTLEDADTGETGSGTMRVTVSFNGVDAIATLPVTF